MINTYRFQTQYGMLQKKKNNIIESSIQSLKGIGPKKAKTLKIDIVPIIGRGTLIEAADLVRNGFTSKWGDFTAEGLVMRPAVDLLNRRNNRIITKIKYKDFN